MRYLIVSSTTVQGLEDKVNNLVETPNCRPVGGVAVHFDSKEGLFGKTYYTQALVSLNKNEAI